MVVVLIPFDAIVVTRQCGSSCCVVAMAGLARWCWEQSSLIVVPIRKILIKKEKEEKKQEAYCCRVFVNAAFLNIPHAFKTLMESKYNNYYQ